MKIFLIKVLLPVPVIIYAEFLERSLGFFSFMFLAGIVTVFIWQWVDDYYGV